ncbi:hypothetical protein CEE36_09100 [candidate division TA06 bacterium B3_TA06]|uniref:Uncharacterized protein n=1 Tax=candidate division TA06 bacterium B3_TA06 TaxID=2012487 RepID=A0A532V0Z4_UNCT6|nr:MAG: hypothetical protein CEE36_09100 [candidate division TA06 bacterium B3_TA06]
MDTFLDRDIIARESEAPKGDACGVPKGDTCGAPKDDACGVPKGDACGVPKDDACGVLSYVAEHEDLMIP